MTSPADGWDAAYLGTAPPPWDIGHPQPAFARLAEAGLLRGRLLDAGCGTGENALLAAAHGCDVTGIDLSPHAISLAKTKAAERHLSADLRVASALDLAGLNTAFDTLIDSGLFHVFDDTDRASYVASLATATHPGSTLYLMCFSDRQPGDFGPRRITQDEITAAFATGWLIASITAEQFEIGAALGATAQAWLATIHRSHPEQQ